MPDHSLARNPLLPHDLFDRAKAVNEFRNTRVAHQEASLTNSAEAKAALVAGVDAMHSLWQPPSGGSREGA